MGDLQFTEVRCVTKTIGVDYFEFVRGHVKFVQVLVFAKGVAFHVDYVVFIEKKLVQTDQVVKGALLNDYFVRRQIKLCIFVFKYVYIAQ